MVIRDRGLKGYLMFLKQKQPRIYLAIQAKLKPGMMAGLGEVTDYVGMPTLDIATTASSAAPSSSFANSLKALVNGAAQLYLTKAQLDAQKKITNMQLQRAAQGLPPLDMNVDQYGLAPTARVGLTSDTSKLLMYGALGIGGLWLLTSFMGRRR